ncbi:MAG: OmpH family outer membrane protein [Bacteroidota bacterium]|nr:OmpH family outer membrane protein [Bacteroidota bacterium]
MKNLSIALNVLLIIAVAFLYYKVYNSGTAPLPAAQLSGAGMPSNAIVFINSDTLLADYKFFNDLKDNLEKKQDSIDTFLKTRAQSLEQEVMGYQERGAMMSPEQRAKEEERLMGKQQNLMDLKQSMVENLQAEESDMNDSIHNNLSRYLREYNKDKNYLYILGYQRGSGILLAHDSLDITREILEGLNKK